MKNILWSHYQKSDIDKLPNRIPKRSHYNLDPTRGSLSTHSSLYKQAGILYLEKLSDSFQENR